MTKYSVAGFTSTTTSIYGNGFWVFIPNDPPAFPIATIKGKSMWQSHPTTKVIETGYFCPICGLRVTHKTKYAPCLEDDRGIRY